MTEPVVETPSAWRHRGFRQLAVSWVFTNVGDAALFLMLAVWVKDLSGSDAAAAMVFVVLGLPALAAPFLGQLADRMSRKRLLVVGNMVMVGVVASLFLVDAESMLWLVYVVTFLYGAMGYLNVAAQSGLVRDLLTDEELASGNGVLSTIDQLLRLVSPLLGTGLYVLAGPHAVVGLTAATFVVTGLLLTRVEVVESPPAPSGDGPAAYWRELVAGVSHLAGTPVLGRLTVILAVGLGATGLVNATVFPAMEQGLGVDPATLGVLVSIQGVGAVLGGVTSARLVNRLGERRTVGVGMVLLALGLLPLAGTSIVAVVVGLVMLGVGIPWVVVAYTTLRQRLTPAELQGRVAAASNVAISVPQTAATIPAAAMLGVVDYRLLIFATVIGSAVAALTARPFTSGPAQPEPAFADPAA